MGTFLKKAEELGLDVQNLKNKKSFDTTIMVDSIDKLKTLFSGEINPDAQVAAENATPLTIAEKLHDHVFLNAPLTEKESVQLDHVMPLAVRAITLQEKTLGVNEVWDLGNQTSYIVLDKLTMEAGSSIKISCAVLTMKIGTLVRNAGNSVKGVNYDLGIFGAQGADCAKALKGTNGGKGGDGAEGTCCSGGGIAGDDGKPGADGGDGGKGSQGLSGNNGSPSLTANITITKGIEGTAGQFIIYTKSGAGGNGGQGGDGGNGGDGGKGGNGATCACEHTDGGNGGKGGKSGDGGDGGEGGDAVKGYDIFVNVPKGQGNRIIKMGETAKPGAGGVNGSGGTPGAGGAGGTAGGKSGCPSGKNGNNGTAGGAGNSGVNGKNGTQSGAPGQIFVNEN